jgi:hypothetical protein
VIELLLEAERALSFGLTDRAEALYRQVVSADPRNSIAVVGLARVALEHSDDAGALVFARQALAIDGENVAAQRLVERLEEVLTTRGDPIPEPTPAPRPAPTASAVPAPSATAPSVVAAPPAGEPEHTQPPTPSAPAVPTRRRSLLDRIRGR